jgi:hypothetical protein
MPQLSLAVEVTNGRLTNMVASDSDGNVYDVTIQISPRPVSSDDAIANMDDDTVPPAGVCCKDDMTLCRFVAGAPPCPAGYHPVDTSVVIKP